MKLDDLQFHSDEERRQYLSDLARLKRIREEEKRRLSHTEYHSRRNFEEYEEEDEYFDDEYEDYEDDEYDSREDFYEDPYEKAYRRRRINPHPHQGAARRETVENPGADKPHPSRSSREAYRHREAYPGRSPKTDPRHSAGARGADAEAKEVGQKRGKKKKKKAMWLLIPVLLLLFSGIYFAFQIFTKQTGYYTIAVFGVDSRDGNLGKGALADVNIICNINRESGEIQLVSVYRDTYTEIDGKGTYHKLNEAYFRGGPEQAISALERNLDLDIEGYATFNWKAIADAINILGGIDLEITDAEFKYINSFITSTVESTGVGSHHLKAPGMNHLDGVQAVAYARLRLMDTDFQRTARQRKVVSLAFDKAKSADFNTLRSILMTVYPQISTDLALDDLLPFAKDVKKYHLGESAGFPFEKAGADIGKKDCIVPVTLKTNVKALHEFLYKDGLYMPSGTVEQINKRIINDSGIGADKDSSTSINTDKPSEKKNNKESTKAAVNPETSPAAESSPPQSSEESTAASAEETSAESTVEESTENLTQAPETTPEVLDWDIPDPEDPEEIGPGMHLDPAETQAPSRATLAPVGPGEP
ncbi:MAG: LCP family protein [Johnsonella sp.]|nr:LCP family protein [Johnsonella sp.]